jgi:hypothetical protein
MLGDKSVGDAPFADAVESTEAGSIEPFGAVCGAVELIFVPWRGDGL